MRGNLKLMNWSYAVLDKNRERLPLELDVPDIDEAGCLVVLSKLGI